MVGVGESQRKFQRKMEMLKLTSLASGHFKGQVQRLQNWATPKVPKFLLFPPITLLS